MKAKQSTSPQATDKTSTPTEAREPQQVTILGLLQSSPMALAMPDESTNHRLRHNHLLRLQRSVGNSAVQRMLSSQGAPLPSPLAHKLSPTLGDVTQKVRLHHDAPVKTGALATTEGYDVMLSPAAPATDTPAGELLLTHELIHVLQQNEGGMTATDPEAQADEAAVAALLGKPLGQLGSATGPQYFEARWHQATLTNAMAEQGFSDKEAETAYFANWMRDVSQAFVPIAAETVGVDATYSLLELISLWKFGRSFTPEQMGMYNPVDHIDNPAGQINADLIQSTDSEGNPITPGDVGGRDVAGRGRLEETFESIGSESIESLFAVNDAGVPAYMERSRNFIKQEAEEALLNGRTEAGLINLGNLSHTIEDLFAHSNWIEIAVTRVLQSGEVDLSDTPAAQQMQEREEQGMPPIETFAGEIADAEGNVRPILMTGTFTTTDTIISIKEEVTTILSSINPFAESNDEKKWKFVRAVLEKVEDSVDEGTAGDIFAAHLDRLVYQLGDFLSEQAGSLTQSAGESASEAVGGGMLGDVLEGAAGLVGEGVQGAVGAGQEIYRDQMRDLIIEITNELGPAVPLLEMATYVKEGVGKLADAWQRVKDWIAGLPSALKEWLLPKVVAAEKAFKEAIKKVVTEAWERGVQLLMDALEGVAPHTDTAETNVGVQLEDLRRKLHSALGEVAHSELRDRVIQQIDNLPIAQLSTFIGSGEFRTLLDQLDNARQIADLAETGERIAQIANLPGWARAGASHSQIAKDHADSPFFATAFIMANTADNIIVTAVRDAWAALGDTGPAAGMDVDYGELNPEEAGEHDEFLRTREMGQQVLTEGAPEEAHPAHRLIEALEAALAIPGAYPIIGHVTEVAVNHIRANPYDVAAFDAVDEAITAMEEWMDTVRISGDERLVAMIDVALHAVTGLLGEQREMGLTEPMEHDDHAHGGEEGEHGERSEAFYHEQIEDLNQYRGQGNRIAVDEVRPEIERPSASGEALPEPADLIADPLDRIEAEVDRIFAHPYDSNWWWSTLVSWANANKNVLAGYIMSRNSGRIHHHHHGGH